MNMIQFPHIKICGLRDEATIAAMNGLPITEVGLVFAPSKRQVTVEQGAELAAAIKGLSCLEGKAPRAAGVFVNLELSSMEELLRQVPLDIVQLHGQESVNYYAELKQQFPNTSLWKVVSIKASNEDKPALTAKGAPLNKTEHIEQQLANELAPYAPYVEAILLDAPGGGTGIPFNWQAISAYKRVTERLEKQLIIAGGLHEGNVRQLLEQYEVDGVDVSSGVETDGIKDISKINQFVRKVIEA